MAIDGSLEKCDGTSVTETVECQEWCQPLFTDAGYRRRLPTQVTDTGYQRRLPTRVMRVHTGVNAELIDLPIVKNAHIAQG